MLSDVSFLPPLKIKREVKRTKNEEPDFRVQRSVSLQRAVNPINTILVLIKPMQVFSFNRYDADRVLIRPSEKASGMSFSTWMCRISHLKSPQKKHHKLHRKVNKFLMLFKTGNACQNPKRRFSKAHVLDQQHPGVR